MNEILNGSPTGLMVLGFGIFLTVCFYAWIWKNNPRVAMLLLLIGIIVGLLFGLDWDYIRDKVFITPEGDLGDLVL